MDVSSCQRGRRQVVMHSTVQLSRARWTAAAAKYRNLNRVNRIWIAQSSPWLNNQRRTSYW